MANEWIEHQEHDHRIFKVNERNIFTCKGCNELGTGQHYKCKRQNSRCNNFHLHIACAEASEKPSVYRYQHRYSFHTKPVDDHRYCVACGKRVRRYNYHCRQQNLDLHPSCADDFPREITVNNNNVRLQLRERLHGRCQHCNESRYKGGSQNTWAYVSYCGRYQYFAGCVLDSRVRQLQQALNNMPIGQGNHNQGGGRGQQIVDVIVGGADFFNEVVRAFTGFPF